MRLRKSLRFSALMCMLLLLAAFTSAQSVWSLVNALSTGNDCYQLTKKLNHKKGAAWSNTMLNLKKPFEVNFQFNFGTTDNGADGITLVLQKSGAGLNAIGDDGAMIGYSSILTPITPSLDIEFDTYNNGSWLYNDIADDHCAINGGGLTGWNLAPAVPLLGPGVNVEDNQYHKVKVTWQPSTTTIQVYFDCNLIQTLVYDLIPGIFNGDSLVYYGLTSGTGSADNAHYFCELYLDAGTDTTFCPGIPVTLSGNSNFSSYTWSPATGLSCTNCLNPIANPGGTTKYVLTGTLGCLTSIDTVVLTTNCIVLPIELTSFSASCGKNFVDLKWSTASELNNDYFQIERSADARNYEAIGTVDGSGNSSSSHNYSFSDEQPLPGTSYYRLKQVDFDNTYSFSNMESVNCNTTLGLFLYPNPSRDETHLQIESSAATTVTCVVISMSGKTIFLQEVKVIEGTNEILLDNSQVMPGVYDVAVISRDKVLHSLLVIQ